MLRSLRILTAALLAVLPVSCSTAKPARTAVAPAETTATFTITPGVKVVSSIPLPPGFLPLPGHAPLWLQNGSEIAVIGTIDGHVVVLGYSGAGWREQRVLASETGPAAVEEGTIADLSASPDGLTLALAVAPLGEKRLDIILRDVIATGPGHPIAVFDGSYDSVSMSWLNAESIAIALRAHPEPREAATASADPGDQQEPPRPSDGLQILVVAGAGSVAPMNLNSCPMSRLSWSEHGVYAIGEGDANTPPVAIDRAHSTCKPFGGSGPIHVIAWSRTSEASFLYVQSLSGVGSVGLFKYDLVKGSGGLVAASSTAGAYTADDSIMAVGNQQLNARRLANRGNAPVQAELAIFDPADPQVDIKTLGFETLPSMLAQSQIAYTPETNRAAIGAFAPAVPVPSRKILIYAARAENALQVATGPAQGVAELSWSPRGRWLAIEDGAAPHTTLTVILPPPG